MAILNNYRKQKMDLLLYNDKYTDFVLSLDRTRTINVDGSLTTKCLSSFVDFSNKRCIDGSSIVSLPEYTYENSVNNGLELNNIGFTGIDNGLILYDKYEITNRDFLKILTKSKYEIESDDYRLHVNPISGNTCVYDYSYDITVDESGETQYASLYGGFFQGFYKVEGHDYQVLPSALENCWHVEMTVRPMDYTESGCTINKIHPDNKGIMFYIGTRSENKFAQFYNSGIENYTDRVYCEELKVLCDSFYDNQYFVGDYVNDSDVKNIPCNYFTKNHLDPTDILTVYPDYEHNVKCDCNSVCDTTINEKHVDTCDNGNFLFESDYMFDDIKLNPSEIETDDNYKTNEGGYFSIKTDNKFLIFDHTKEGFDVDTWNEGDVVEFVFQDRSSKSDNLYLLMHNAKGGLNVDTIDSYYDEIKNQKEYNIMSDVKNNSFALKVNEDGSVGYKYLIKDCDNENGWSIKEEYSFPNMIKKGEWSVINTKFEVLNGGIDKCGNPYGERRMKIYIYVNGYLKFVSKELPCFDFRALNEIPSKQEGVPFNISIGGGTQGLCDSVWNEYFYPFKKVLPIEENFSGSFIGDVKSFRFYSCCLEYNEIKNNYLYEKRYF